MPIVPITGDQSEHDSINIVAYMLYHDDKEKREELINSFSLELILKTAQNNSFNNITSKHLRRIQRTKEASLLINEIFDRHLHETGVFVGMALDFCYSQSNIDISEVSWSKAQTALGCRLKEDNPIIPESTFDRYTAKYKPVAHLWASALFFYMHFNPAIIKDILPPPFTIFHFVNNKHTILFQFMELAEEYRRFGETTTPHRSSKGPILSPGKTWKAPPEYPKSPEIGWAKKLLSKRIPSTEALETIRKFHEQRHHKRW